MNVLYDQAEMIIEGYKAFILKMSDQEFMAFINFKNEYLKTHQNPGWGNWQRLWKRHSRAKNT